VPNKSTQSALVIEYRRPFPDGSLATAIEVFLFILTRAINQTDNFLPPTDKPSVALVGSTIRNG